jgi:hypothetical protein
VWPSATTTNFVALEEITNVHDFDVERSKLEHMNSKGKGYPFPERGMECVDEISFSGHPDMGEL